MGVDQGGIFMKATLIYGAGDIRVETVPDPKLHEPTDAVVRVLRSCICGSDLWPYGSMPAQDHGDRIGHEFLGVVEEVGADVSGLKSGDVVVAPFVWSDNTCDFCRGGLQTSCRHGGQWGSDGVDGGQGEAVRCRRRRARWSGCRSGSTPRCCRRCWPSPTCSPRVITAR
jgi:threonine dehydrogenase-like Zn-dependent dehydrogenase